MCEAEGVRLRDGDTDPLRVGLRVSDEVPLSDAVRLPVAEMEEDSVWV